jgi:GT2 family glycosyltransferase
MSGAGPAVSVIVVSWNTKDLLRTCLTSVREHLALPCEVIVVDNASRDGSAEMVAEEFPTAQLVRNERNLGFGAANNIGMAEAVAPAFLLLNSDARLVDGSIARLVEKLHRDPGVGLVGPRLRFEDGRLQASAHRFSSLRLLALEELGLYKLLPRRTSAEALLGAYWDHSRERRVDWIVGACMVVRRAAFEKTGGFDPGIFLYGEEVEWCERIRAAGWQVVFSPEAEVVHVGHASADILVGDRGRIDLCLVAADELIARRQGRAAGLAASGLRVSGAVIKTVAFGLRRLAIGDDRYGRDVRAYSRTVLGHYLRRARGRAGRGA